ncbi:hypothetical protein X735_33195, partial [Mesorhizobium sp. L2C085B000]
MSTAKTTMHPAASSRRNYMLDVPAAIRQPINLPAHKAAGVRDAIEAAGATLLYLPPYSPDFNVYGWLLRVKGIGSGLVNRSVAAMY